MLNKTAIYRFFLSLPLILAPITASSENNGEELLKKISKGFASVAKAGTPAVVYIESQKTPEEEFKQRSKRLPSENPFDYFHDEFFNRFFGFQDEAKKKPETVRGSGFIISSDGYIMTNNHVVSNATKINVTLAGGRKTTAEVIGTDAKTDLAVIKIKETNLPYLEFGDSDKLQVGDWAIAIGNPFGLEATVTVGVVSAKGRSNLHITDFEDFLQTDAAINPGNSGGPLLNVEGEVIGINTAIVSGSGGYMGIGFAIPSNMATGILDQLINEGSVTRGYLGVTLQPIDGELANYYKLDKTEGAFVSDIVKGSPADSAGIKQEDIILKYNNIPVETLTSFRNAISFLPPGKEVTLQILRDGKIKEIRVTVVKAPNDSKIAPSSKKLGLEVQNLTPELANQLGYVGEKGVVVTKVEKGSAADDAMIKPGTLIMAINRKKISNVDEFAKTLSQTPKDSPILLMVRQGELTRFVALQLSEKE